MYSFESFYKLSDVESWPAVSSSRYYIGYKVSMTDCKKLISTSFYFKDYYFRFKNLKDKIERLEAVVILADFGSVVFLMIPHFNLAKVIGKHFLCV